MIEERRGNLRGTHALLIQGTTSSKSESEGGGIYIYIYIEGKRYAPFFLIYFRYVRKKNTTTKKKGKGTM